MDLDEKPIDIKVKENMNCCSDVTITWSDGHSSTFTEDWLRARGIDRVQGNFLDESFQNLNLWGAEQQDRVRSFQYRDLVEDTPTHLGIASHGCN